MGDALCPVNLGLFKFARRGLGLGVMMAAVVAIPPSTVVSPRLKQCSGGRAARSGEKREATATMTEKADNGRPAMSHGPVVRGRPFHLVTGKIKPQNSSARSLEAFAARHTVVAVSPRIAYTAAFYAFAHRDPCDRHILATAEVYRLPLVTIDAELTKLAPALGVTVVW